MKRSVMMMLGGGGGCKTNEVKKDNSNAGVVSTY